MAQALKHAGRATEAAGSVSSPLQASLQNLFETASGKAMTSVSDRLSGATERLTDYAQGGGSGLLSAVTGVDKLGPPIKSALRAGVGSVTGKVKESLQQGVAASLSGQQIRAVTS